MILLLVSLFFILLIVGMPISVVLLITTSIGVIMVNGNLIIIAQQIFDGLDKFVILAIPFFIMSGTIASRGQIARKLVNVGEALFGNFYGGLGIATIFACTIFAAISGSAMATVVAIGSVMIPMLQEKGYPKSIAVGVCTGAGSLGVLVPPSIPMVLVCVAMGTSIGAQFMAGFLPALLIAFLFSLYMYFISRKNKLITKHKYSLIEVLKLIKDSIWALLFPIIILGGIYSGITTPTEAAAVSLIYVIIIEVFVYKDVNFKDLNKLLFEGSMMSSTLCIILAAALTLTWFLTTQGLPTMLAQATTTHINSGSIFLVYMILVLLFFGFFIETIALVIIIGPLLLPTLAAFGIDPIHFGIMAIVMNLVGMLTPPFGLCLFVGTSVSKEPLWKVARYTTPYLIILLIAALLIAFIPEISLFLPRLLL